MFYAAAVTTTATAAAMISHIIILWIYIDYIITYKQYNHISEKISEKFAHEKNTQILVHPSSHVIFVPQVMQSDNVISLHKTFL